MSAGRDDRPAIVWFRRDLRLADNPALAAAAQSDRPIIPLFLLDFSDVARRPGAASLWWLDKSLRALAAALEARGSRLVLARGDPLEALPALQARTGAALVTWNRVHEPPIRRRDEQIEAILRQAGAETATFNASLVFEPGTVATKTGTPYAVFTPFWRAARSQVGDLESRHAPARLAAPATWPASDRLEGWGLHPRKPDWSKGFKVWRVGEDAAKAALRRLVERRLQAYPTLRDRLDQDGGSRLSPHLAWGELGARQVWRAVAHARDARPGLDGAADKFLSELGWREFAYGALDAHPDLAHANLDAAFDDFPWRRSAPDVAAWKAGRTGYPVVDAGMRQLWTEGWMPNRVRMVAASFLIKHLRIDWRVGEAWFWDTLVDADPANNPFNWQWVAGSGMDAAPFFRIFNPVTQGETFDPTGAYVRRWLPELAKLPDRRLHAPWTATGDELEAAGVRLGETYPQPIVDHQVARAQALEAFGSLKGRRRGP